MRKSIDQFMWPLQQFFRICVAIDTKMILDEIGMPVQDLQVLLVGMANEDSVRHPTCIEPETGPLRQEHLLQVKGRAVELYNLNPQSQSFDSHRRLHELRQRSLFLYAQADAVREAIEKTGLFSDLTFFVSHSSLINGYDVHTCVGIPTEAIANLPSFKESEVGRFYVGQSLQHEVVRECLFRADSALQQTDPEEQFAFAPISLGNADDIIKTATERFVSGIGWRSAKESSDLSNALRSPGILSALNKIASLTYERDAARGTLAITSRENLEKWLIVKFKEPVGVEESRTMRKLLQMSDGAISVLADPAQAYGLGLSKPAPDVVEVSITGHAKWEASVNGDKFVRVAYGKPTIPHQPIEFEELADIAERIIGDTNTKLIWGIVQAAQGNGQGTTLVVSADPEAESARLSSQGMPIDPDYLEPKLIVRLASVDGAVIIGPDGRCHAFGVILDGIANESGDRARGSRFNSAVRYQNMGETPNSIIIVISDDGTIDLLPRLMPRVHREEVVEVVNEFCRCCDSTPVDSEEFARLYERVELFRFYLNEEQCRMVNEKHEQEMERRLASGGTAVTRRELKIAPRMNESYFWDSQTNLAH